MNFNLLYKDIVNILSSAIGDKLQDDPFYVKNMSLILDLAIMLTSIQIILLGRGK